MAVKVSGSDGVNQSQVTGATQLPVGTNAERPASPEAGMMRFNTDEGYVEWYDDATDLWYPTSQFVGAVATGGTVTEITQDGIQYRVHTFTSDGTFEVTRGGEVEYLVVGGGGGGGGGFQGGGGGAGGLIFSDAVAFSVGTYSVVVGSGGNGAPAADIATNGDNGENSSFNSEIAIGGGVGATERSSAASPRFLPSTSGGSGGGGSHPEGQASELGSAGEPGQGNKGGDGKSTIPRSSGGGGGAGTAGEDGSAGAGGAGGEGLFFGNVFGTSVGESGWFAGGGQGARRSTLDEQRGGQGGGGNVNASGMAFTGGGGGGGTAQPEVANTGGAAGGSGVVIVRYRIG